MTRARATCSMPLKPAPIASPRRVSRLTSSAMPLASGSSTTMMS